MSRISNPIIGTAGTYFAAAELSRRGAIVLSTVRNTRGADLIAVSIDGRNFATIQVKTSGARPNFWPLGSALDPTPPDNFFFVFVRNARLTPTGTPPLPPMEAFVVPARDVVETANSPDPSKSWGAGSWPHDNRPPDNYLNRWDLILGVLSS
jgi:hypothetical protein